MTIYQHSVAGQDDRGAVSLLTNQPIVFVNLPHDIYLRSTGIWTFNRITKDYYIPVGLGVGKVWPIANKVKLNTFVEPQYTVLHDGVGLPRWQIYAGFNLQIAVR